MNLHNYAKITYSLFIHFLGAIFIYGNAECMSGTIDCLSPA